MPVCILLSDFGKNGFHCNIAQEIKQVITDTRSILFIASDPNGHEKTDKYSELFFSYFRNAGIAFESYEVMDNRKMDEEYKNAVENASCVFLLGGLTLAQRDFLHQNDLVEPLKSHKGVVIGMSAGAINMADYSVIANPNHPPVRTFEGMGLVDITVIPHFNNVDIPYLTKEVFPLTNRSVIYGICDDAAIIVQEGVKKHIGTIYRITPGSIKLLTEKEQIV